MDETESKSQKYKHNRLLYSSPVNHLPKTDKMECALLVCPNHANRKVAGELETIKNPTRIRAGQNEQKTAEAAFIKAT